MMLEGQLVSVLPSAAQKVDAATKHWSAFCVMGVLAFVVGLTKVAKQTQISVRFRSFLNLWICAYLLMLGCLMSVTTAMALVLLVDDKGASKAAFLPDSFIPMAAAVFGVLGFEILLNKFVIGFGENRLEVGALLQDLIDQAVAATLKKQTG